MANGKTTEFLTSQKLRSFYKLNVMINRLPDKYDTGRYEDIRPSDFMVTLSRKVAPNNMTSFFIECKESEKLKTSFGLASTFRKGQLQAMRMAKILEVPYFVVFNFLSTKEIFLVPSTEILDCLEQGKKSISIDTIRKYPWTTGELYDY